MTLGPDSMLAVPHVETDLVHWALQELDRIRGRGQQGAQAPLLWEEGQVEELLQGSPVVSEVHHRLQVVSCSRPIPGVGQLSA